VNTPTRYRDVTPKAQPLADVLCLDLGELFAVTTKAEHDRAKALCAQCLAFDACAADRDRMLAEGRPISGTWAGMRLVRSRDHARPAS
jgi:hypothetical protein